MKNAIYEIAVKFKYCRIEIKIMLMIFLAVYFVTGTVMKEAYLVVAVCYGFEFMIIPVLSMVGTMSPSFFMLPLSDAGVKKNIFSKAVCHGIIWSGISMLGHFIAMMSKNHQVMRENIHIVILLNIILMLEIICEVGESAFKMSTKKINGIIKLLVNGVAFCVRSMWFVVMISITHDKSFGIDILNGLDCTGMAGKRNLLIVCMTAIILQLVVIVYYYGRKQVFEFMEDEKTSQLIHAKEV